MAMAAYDAGDVRGCYQAALRAIYALQPEDSVFTAVQLNFFAVQATTRGALGPTWRWGQLAPFVTNARSLAPRLRRWMPPAAYDAWFKDKLQEYDDWERQLKGTNR